METKVLITDGELAGQEGWLTAIDVHLEPRQWEVFLPKAGRLLEISPDLLRPLEVAAHWPPDDTRLYLEITQPEIPSSLGTVLSEEVSIDELMARMDHLRDNIHEQATWGSHDLFLYHNRFEQLNPGYVGERLAAAVSEELHQVVTSAPSCPIPPFAEQVEGALGYGIINTGRLNYELEHFRCYWLEPPVPGKSRPFPIYRVIVQIPPGHRWYGNTVWRSYFEPDLIFEEPNEEVFDETDHRAPSS